jgi:hypothetical protein
MNSFPHDDEALGRFDVDVDRTDDCGLAGKSVRAHTREMRHPDH